MWRYYTKNLECRNDAFEHFKNTNKFALGEVIINIL